MTARLAKGAARLLLALWAAATLTFFLAQSLPGDPALAILGGDADPRDIARLRRELGLDRPLPQRYGRALLRLAACDLGDSLVDRRPVLASLRDHLPHTALLALASMLLAVPFSLLLGFLSVAGRSRLWVVLAAAFAAVGLAVPVFLVGFVLVQVFSVGLGFFPVSGVGGLRHLALPAATLAFPLGAALTRLTRTVLLQEAQRPYVLLAQAKGLSPAQACRRHILPNALPPLVTAIGMQVGSLLGGALVVEHVYSWPGIGMLLVSAARRRDLPVLQGVVLLAVALCGLANLLADLTLARLDPRVAHGRHP